MGALCLVVATDPERYRPLVRFLGVVFALVSVVFLAVDLSAGMPWWWTASEGLCETCAWMREMERAVAQVGDGSALR